MVLDKFFFKKAEYEKKIAELEEENRKLREKLSWRKKSEGSSRLTIVGLKDGIIRLDEKNRITYLNSTVSKLFDLNREEVIGKRVDQIRAIPWSGWLFRQMVEEAKRENTTVEKEESFYQASSGRMFYFNIKVSVIGEKPQILLEDISQEKMIELNFKRYVSPEVVEKMKYLSRDFFKAERVCVTVLFADIRDFTSLARELPPAEVRNYLNTFLSQVIEIVYQYEGTLDKFIGDEVMALFGAPIYYENHSHRALQTAIEIQRKVDLPPPRHQQKREIGIGINTGEVVVGNIGSEKRMEYTAIGHHVNIARRLCDLAQGKQILISEDTYHHLSQKEDLSPEIGFIPLEKIPVKGLNSALKVYEVNFRR